MRSFEGYVFQWKNELLLYFDASAVGTTSAQRIIRQRRKLRCSRLEITSCYEAIIESPENQVLPKIGKTEPSRLLNLLKNEEKNRLLVLHQDSEHFFQNANVNKGINYRMYDYNSTLK